MLSSVIQYEEWGGGTLVGGVSVQVDAAVAQFSVCDHQLPLHGQERKDQEYAP